MVNVYSVWGNMTGMWKYKATGVQRLRQPLWMRLLGVWLGLGQGCEPRAFLVGGWFVKGGMGR